MPLGRLPRRGLPACTASFPTSKTLVEARRRREGGREAGGEARTSAQRGGPGPWLRDRLVPPEPVVILGPEPAGTPGGGCHPRPGAHPSPRGAPTPPSAQAALVGGGRGRLWRFAPLGGRVKERWGSECARSRVKVRYWQGDNFFKEKLAYLSASTMCKSLKKQKKSLGNKFL